MIKLKTALFFLMIFPHMIIVWLILINFGTVGHVNLFIVVNQKFVNSSNFLSPGIK